MKKRAALMLAVLLACLAACAAAEAPDRDPMIRRFVGCWVNDDYRMYTQADEEDITSRFTEANGDYVWEFYHCLYDAEGDQLLMPNYTRYRQVIDWDTMELVEEDWSLGDLGFTCVTLGEDGETLTITDIPYLEEPQTLHRVSEAEFFGD